MWQPQSDELIDFNEITNLPMLFIRMAIFTTMDSHIVRFLDVRRSFCVRHGGIVCWNFIALFFYYWYSKYGNRETKTFPVFSFVMKFARTGVWSIRDGLRSVVYYFCVTTTCTSLRLDVFISSRFLFSEKNISSTVRGHCSKFIALLLLSPYTEFIR